MILCINCNTETKNKMDLLLEKDSYRDYSELISLAIDNLFVLDQQVKEKGAIFIGNDTTLPGQNNKEIPRAKITHGHKAKSIQQKNRKVTKLARIAPTVVPDLFRVNDIQDVISIPTAEITIEKPREETFTLDRWLFGQYNKLLPAKANCRALLRMTAENQEAPVLEKAASVIGESACLLGDYLAEQDRINETGRDNALATAFPKSGPESEKSRLRYTSQFVGAVNGQGVLSGLLREYRFAGITSGETPRLILTKPAVEFALMPNPVLDNFQSHPAQKFSPEEIEFLLSHINAYVSVEAYTFKMLLKIIADGANTPDSLAKALDDLIPSKTENSFSSSFITSQRSGALSRMADLDLIKRERNGVKVSYLISAANKK